MRMLTLIMLGVVTPVSFVMGADSPTEPEPGFIALGTAEARRPILLGFDNTPLMLDAAIHTGNTTRISESRLAAWSLANVAAGYFGYRQSQASWGVSNGNFHFKDDLHDGLALSDETSHLFAAFHLTRIMDAGYTWTGLSTSASRRLAAANAWLMTFLVEYPIDALNPTQGFGVSDLVFNTAGVVAAYHHTRPGARPQWDIKISVKQSFFDGESRFIAHTDEQYDDFVYWLTVRPVRDRYVPLWLGAGYSTSHREHSQIDKELHLAVGTTIEDIVAIVDQEIARTLRPLGFFYFNLGTKIVLE